MNSTKLYIYPLNSPGIVSAKMWIREGSRADPINQKGIHHLLGSLLGRGCGPYSNKMLGDLIEGSGAGLQCETYEDGMLLSLKCIEGDIYKLLPILGWMVQEPHINSKYMNLERALSIRALKRQKENPFYLAFDGWRNLVYKDGPYGHDPLGSVKALKEIDQNSLLSLSKKLITREKILVIAGSLPKGLKEDIKTIEPFNNLLKTIKDNNLKEQKEFYSLNINNNCSSISLQFEETSQVVIMMGKSTVPYNHSDDILLRLLSCYLGSGMSSKLFIKLREENGVAYDVGIYHPIREIATPFIIHASTSLSKANYTLKLLKEEWKNLMYNSMSSDDLSLAKAKFKGQIAHSSQTVGQRAERKAHLLGQHLKENHDSNILTILNSITTDELQTVAQRHLQAPMLSLCGPKSVLIKLSKTWDG
tara:strand:+ start:5020 stop:6276 length:1257 start_codon:yes stop_codon:yes gene_type:complete